MARKALIAALSVTSILCCAVPICQGAANTGARCIKPTDQVRARELGIAPGVLETGPLNAITDVHGVLVGHTTLISGDTVRTGATAILPHGGNLYQNKVPAGVVVFNGYGKSAGR